jgi:VanZ family protein
MKSKNLHVGFLGGMRAWWPALAWAALIFGLSAIPGQSYPDAPFAAADKVVHVCIYFVLGFLNARAFVRGTRLERHQAFVAAVVLTSLYGMTDEFHQLFVAHRSADWRDVLADSIGALMGVGLRLFVIRGRAGERASVDAR